MDTPAVDVVVVGSGPNGLAAAVTLARAGCSVVVLEAQPTPGGGARTQPLGLAGLRAQRSGADLGALATLPHDLCSAVHPLALASPFMKAFDLAGHGVDLIASQASYAHPLATGAVVAYRDLARTVDQLGPDGAAWQRTFAPLVDAEPWLTALVLDSLRPRPGRPRSAAMLAAAALAAAMVTAPRSGRAGALFGGVAAHAMARLGTPAAHGTGLLLGTLGHGGGWPVPRGGSEAITQALLADVVTHGGEVRTNWPVRSRADLPPARDYIFDTSVPTVLDVLGDDLPAHVRAGLRQFRHGPGVAVVTLVLDGPVPWTHAEVGEASTVHLGGSLAQMRTAQADVRSGRHASAPIVLLGDPTVVDPQRGGPHGAGGARVVWAYAHVPAGSTRDVTADVLSQVERFAPHLRDRLLATRCVPAANLSEHNENLARGDISTGAVTTWQMLARPRLAFDRHLLGEVGSGATAYLASAASPPGPGVHGMGGLRAARSLARRRGIDLGPLARV